VAEADASRKSAGSWELFSGFKLSGERDGGLGLARFSAVCPLGGHMCANGFLWHARSYGRCCMYGPNYVKLSRVFAVQLFSVLIRHYAALPPVRFDPARPLAPQPCHHRLHSPRPHPYTATHTARDPNLGGGNHDMSRLSTPAYPNDAPIHGLTDIPSRLLSTDIGGMWCPRRSLSIRHGNTQCSRLKPRRW
jgi:hypothetical protein